MEGASVVGVPQALGTLNDHPLFVREVTVWASALPVEDVQLLRPSLGQTVLQLLSKNGNRLVINLLPIAGNSASTDLRNQESTSDRRITLWEDLWYTKPQIVKSRIAAQLGLSERIPARLTQVRRLDRPITLKFLQENHLQDAVLSKFKYGLFLPKKHYRVLENPPDADELLVAAGTFAHPRQFVREGLPHRSFELVRFANLLNTTVVGGLDKLLSHFIKQHQPDDLMTYADLEWSDGHSYQKLGFESVSDTSPQVFWVDPRSMQRYHPNRLPNGMTEQSALEQGFVAVCNAGSRKFVKVLTPTT